MNNKIIVASLVNDLGIGGTARQLVTIDKYLNREVFQHIVISLQSHDNTRTADLDKQNVFIARDEAEVIEIIKKNQVQILYCHRHGRNEPSKDLIARQLPKEIGLVELNTFSAFDGGDFGRRCDTHIFVSQTNLLKYLVQNKLKFDFRKYKVVYGLVDSQNFKNNMPGKEEREAYRRKFDLDGYFIIGRIARPVMGKWDEATVLFWQKISKSNPKAKLIIYGVPEERKSLLASVGDNHRLIMLDQTSSDKELALFYSNIDVLVHLSPIGECSCGAIAEAMLFSKPIVVTSTPFPRRTFWRSHTKDNGQVEQIKNGLNGFVVNNDVAMAKAVGYLSDNPGEAIKMGETNRKELLEKYEVAVGIKTLEKIFIENLMMKSDELSDSVRTYFNRLKFFPDEQNITGWFDEYKNRLTAVYCPECSNSLADKRYLLSWAIRKKTSTLFKLLKLNS